MTLVKGDYLKGFIHPSVPTNQTFLATLDLKKKVPFPSIFFLNDFFFEDRKYPTRILMWDRLSEGAMSGYFVTATLLTIETLLVWICECLCSTLELNHFSTSIKIYIYEYSDTQCAPCEQTESLLVVSSYACNLDFELCHLLQLVNCVDNCWLHNFLSLSQFVPCELDSSYSSILIFIKISRRLHGTRMCM